MRTIAVTFILGFLALASTTLGVDQAGAGGAVVDDIDLFLDQSTATPGSSVTGRLEFRLVTDPSGRTATINLSGTGSAGSTIAATTLPTGLTCTPASVTAPTDLTCTFGAGLQPGTFELRFRLDVVSNAPVGEFWDVLPAMQGVSGQTPAELEIVAGAPTATTTTVAPTSTTSAAGAVTTTTASSAAPTAAPTTTAAAAAAELAATGSSLPRLLVTVALAIVAVGALAMVAARRSRGAATG